jgi:hypothetical protein
MRNKLLPLLEYLLLIAAIFLLVAFVGLSPLEQNPVKISAPPSPKLIQGSEAWDNNLVLPSKSDRNLAYTMDVKLDTKSNTINGSEILEWKNYTGQPQSQFPFHLYHNAWKNNRSTYAKESGWDVGRPGLNEDEYGWTNVRRVVLIDAKGETDITGTFKYIQPDDNNADDQTVFQIETPKPVPAGQTVKFKIDFETKQPLALRRTGYMRDYHFVVQWFPKIGVWWKNAWNCHQFHVSTEFFADYAFYDVKITVPGNYVIGASGGIPKSVLDNADGTKTHRFVQEDIHDFAWVTAPDLVRTERTFIHKLIDKDERSDRHHPLREVKVILLSQPQHDNMIERYFTATFNALRYFGEWYGEYPYETVTVVDPANDSRSGGMEYPTLFTGGTNMFSPVEQSSPEGVTVHEFGHQFWYALVGNNEFEEAWLDEGFNTYSTDRVMRAAYKPFKPVYTFFGGAGAANWVGIPFVFHEIDQTGLVSENTALRRTGKNDIMMRKGWEYYQTYGLNSYTKPGLSLMMLERYLGEEMMYRVMRTYHFRYRFKHPTSQDFINTVNEVSGKNMNWLFENTWFSSNTFDYSIDNIANKSIPPPTGIFNINGGAKDTTWAMKYGGAYECEVIVKREGEAIAPVDVLVTFENGDQKHEQWDGQYRWKKFTYYSDSKIRSAVVDPDHKLVMDINWNNNSKVLRGPGFQSLAARKLASKFLLWVQTYLETSSYWN